MEQRAICRSGSSGRFSSYERLAAIGLSILAVLSPLYIDRRQASEPEDDEQPINLAFLLPLLLLVLIVAITLSRCMDRSLIRFDPYWIHRVGGSSVGICVLLLVLASVLICKASIRNWDA